MICEIKGVCQFEACDKPATKIAANGYDHGKYAKPACYCDVHATIVADETVPEYINECPNCGCVHGVN